MGFFISDGYRKNAQDADNNHQHFEYWSDIVCNEFVKLDCIKMDTNHNQQFNGELRGGVGIGDVRFAEVISDAHQVQRSKHQISKSSEADFLISFQLAQQGIIRQNGREAILTLALLRYTIVRNLIHFHLKKIFINLLFRCPKKF